MTALLGSAKEKLRDLADPTVVVIGASITAGEALSLLAAIAVADAAQQFRSVFYVDDHEYGKRAQQTYEAVRALDQALEALNG